MGKGLIALAVIGIIVLLIGGWLVAGLNNIVRLDESVNSAWAQIENQLQRRNDLIPNLVNTVKGYAAHEQGLLTEITDLRSQWGRATSQKEK
ncbi:MAG: LemA family protein, partial [Candidatus Omnitrophica bacterium]|nr:LemA family protein [Candidatus Omnitrophota bacterium]